MNNQTKELLSQQGFYVPQESNLNVALNTKSFNHLVGVPLVKILDGSVSFNNGYTLDPIQNLITGNFSTLGNTIATVISSQLDDKKIQINSEAINNLNYNLALKDFIDSIDYRSEEFCGDILNRIQSLNNDYNKGIEVMNALSFGTNHQFYFLDNFSFNDIILGSYNSRIIKLNVLNLSISFLNDNRNIILNNLDELINYTKRFNSIDICVESIGKQLESLS